MPLKSIVMVNWNWTVTVCMLEFPQASALRRSYILCLPWNRSNDVNKVPVRQVSNSVNLWYSCTVFSSRFTFTTSNWRGYLSTSWWLSVMASLWRGRATVDRSTSRWVQSTSAGPVGCVEILMPMFKMIWRPAMVCRFYCTRHYRLLVSLL